MTQRNATGKHPDHGDGGVEARPADGQGMDLILRYKHAHETFESSRPRSQHITHHNRRLFCRYVRQYFEGICSLHTIHGCFSFLGRFLVPARVAYVRMRPRSPRLHGSKFGGINLGSVVQRKLAASMRPCRLQPSLNHEAFFRRRFVSGDHKPLRVR